MPGPVPDCFRGNIENTGQFKLVYDHGEPRKGVVVWLIPKGACG